MKILNTLKQQNSVEFNDVRELGQSLKIWEIWNALELICKEFFLYILHLLKIKNKKIKITYHNK